MSTQIKKTESVALCAHLSVFIAFYRQLFFVISAVQHFIRFGRFDNLSKLQQNLSCVTDRRPGTKRPVRPILLMTGFSHDVPCCDQSRPADCRPFVEMLITYIQVQEVRLNTSDLHLSIRTMPSLGSGISGQPPSQQGGDIRLISPVPTS